jgi:hypothetical protein
LCTGVTDSYASWKSDRQSSCYAQEWQTRTLPAGVTHKLPVFHRSDRLARFLQEWQTSFMLCKGVTDSHDSCCEQTKSDLVGTWSNGMTWRQT